MSKRMYFINLQFSIGAPNSLKQSILTIVKNSPECKNEYRWDSVMASEFFFIDGDVSAKYWRQNWRERHLPVAFGTKRPPLLKRWKNGR